MAYYNYDLLVLGGGPAGYAAAIRAGQLGKRVLCVEKENLGGTCLNWGCIPTKALLDVGHFYRKIRDEAAHLGITCDNLKMDFQKPIQRSRDIAMKLNKGIGHLFSKYKVKHEMGIGTLMGAHKVDFVKTDGSKQSVTAEHIIIATGAKTRSLPGVELDRKTIITSREAMTLPELPKSMIIIGSGAIGCEFADFYHALGTQITIIELLDHIVPNEDEDCSILLERIYKKRNIELLTKHKTEKVEKTATGVKVTAVSKDGQTVVREGEKLLVAVGVTGNLDNLIGPGVDLEIDRGHVKVDKSYKTNIEGVYAVGDIIGPPWLAHVAHHEAVNCVEHILGLKPHAIDYKQIPGCTYTHPSIASMGLTEKKAREQHPDLRVGKFPFSVSGRALAAGETDGFVKLIFSKSGEVLGVHMIGEHVTELLAEVQMAVKMEATEDTIIEMMHAHPTLSEAVMEAAGVAVNRAIHL